MIRATAHFGVVVTFTTVVAFSSICSAISFCVFCATAGTHSIVVMLVTLDLFDFV